MSSSKHIDAICIAVLAFTLLLTVLFMNGDALGIKRIVSEEEVNGYFTENDIKSDPDYTGATVISLLDGKSSVDGNGAYAVGDEIHIVLSGKYVVSGELSNGKIIVDTENGGKVWLKLNGVSVNCENGAALCVEQAEKVFITLAQDSENAFSCGSSFLESETATGIDGAIFSRDDLTVNGTGSLTVKSEYQHGIVCNDVLVVSGGKVTVEAVQDAIHANDSVRIREAELDITAGDDAITAKNDEKTSFIYVESGKINISSCYEGIESYKITVDGGEINISPTDDGLNSAGTDSESGIYVNGGNISVINPDGRDADGFDSNSSIYINGGSVFISVSQNGGSCALDYGSENGGKCFINGGTVIACGSSVMAEEISPESAQGFIMQSLSGSGGTQLVLKNSAGEKLVEKEIPCPFSLVTVSVPEIKTGDEYALSAGENEITVTAASSYEISGGMPGRGNKQNFNKPDGEMPDSGNGEPPQKPDGEMPDFGNGEPPQKPDGGMPDFGNGEPPEKPDGEMPDFGNGEPP
ncbi:MAG: carbohydrate-binding domain-containing protein [Clostridia bacterium]|nr:carbohydrate-binding domain-containing protein [Clostridia bacterium]